MQIHVFAWSIQFNDLVFICLFSVISVNININISFNFKKINCLSNILHYNDYNVEMSMQCGRVLKLHFTEDCCSDKLNF